MSKHPADLIIGCQSAAAGKGRRVRQRRSEASAVTDRGYGRDERWEVARADRLTFTGAQRSAWANKVRRGFNTTDVAEEFCLLMAEMGEAVDAWRKHRAPPPRLPRRALARLRLRPLPPVVTDIEPVRLEIADVILFALSLAQMLGFGAGDAGADKLRRPRQARLGFTEAQLSAWADKVRAGSITTDVAGGSSAC